MTTSMQQQTIDKEPPRCMQRSDLKRRLVLCVILLCIALALSIAMTIANSGSCDVSDDAAGMQPTKAEALIWGHLLRKQHKKMKTVVTTELEPSNNTDVCHTIECNRTASMILENMDPSIDPCEDFYRYACGGFLKSIKIPDDKTTVDSFTIVEDNVQEQIKKSIEAKININEPKSFRLAKIFYQSCLNTDAIEAKGVEPVLSILRQLGGWPVLIGDSWNETGFDWKSSIYQVHDFGYVDDYFIDFVVDIDLRNSTKYVIYLDQASLGLPRAYLIKGFDDVNVAAYYSYMVDIAVILGASRKHAQEELEKSLNFEIELAKISLPQEERLDHTRLYNPMTLTELIEKFPSLPWKEYLSRLLPSTISIAEDDVVIVKAPTYFAKLEELISATPQRVQANYVMRRVVQHSTRYLNKNVRERALKYTTVRTGRTQFQLRWKECFDIVGSILPVNIDAMYVRKYFDEDAKKNALEMIMDIRKGFTKILKMADWMDEKTRQRALEKIAAIYNYVAYPNELLDDNTLEKFYEKLTLSKDEYFMNTLNIQRFLIELGSSKLRTSANKTDWFAHGKAASVTAMYEPSENSIDVTAGILQGAFFHKDRPKYMNYGAIGYVIGHEITHGFDNTGRQYDKNGNLVQWWEPSTEKKYLERAKCMIDQYSNYTAKEVGLKLNGVTTQGENIADNGAMKAAYFAYNSWVARYGEERKLPGIDRTPRQLFWISSANVWCSKYTPEALKNHIHTNEHSPGEFRVLGTMSNSPEFAKDFKCSKGSKMNPEKKCSVW